MNENPSEFRQIATMALAMGLAAGPPIGYRLRDLPIRKRAKTPAELKRKAMQKAQRKARRITRNHP